MNEGVFSSLFKGVSDVFKSKKSKVDSLLKQIKKAKTEELENRISIEKEIWNLTKENTPEYRFIFSNLNRQIGIYSNLKNQEITSLLKEAEFIIDKNPKLQAYFSSELAKIEADIKEKLLKELSKYKSGSELNTIAADFDSLVKDANKKSAYFETMADQGSSIGAYSDDLSNDVISFVEYSNSDAQKSIDESDEKRLKDLLSSLYNFRFDIDIRNKNEIDVIRKEIKQAKKIGDSQVIDSLENEETKIRSHYRDILERIRSRITMVEKQIKLIRNENN